MEQRRANSSKLRVAVVSASLNQREHLKRLIEGYGPKVIGVSGFRDYNAAMVGQKPDVLLIDLDQADDAALERMERMVEQSKIPILFNESTAIPMMPGPYRDDWVDNLVGKLFSLAQKHNVPASPTLLDRPRYSNTTTRHAVPKVLVISHSKTRRRVLQIILASQAIKETVETSYATGYDRDAIKSYGILLLDEHNVGPEDAAVFEQLLAQSEVPVQLCNSSHIPPGASERTQWGMKLAGQLIKLAKSVDVKAPVAPTNEMTAEEHWGERIASTLSGVRETMKSVPSLHESIAVPKAANDAQADNTPKTSKRSAPSTLRSATKQDDLRKDLKYRPPVKTGALKASSAANAQRDAADASTADTASNVKFAQPIDRFAKPAGVGEIFDANTIGEIANSSATEKSVASLTPEERDAEISRFFNFDTQPGEAAELAIEPLPKAPTVNPSTKQKKAAPLPRKQTIDDGTDADARSKKSIKQWFRSLAGIRQKLPKLFH